ncbi:DUF2637 domain-containing protein [Streptomyces sp. NPDC005180]|uniref:DUF2637 domain-containing protein n=1 Tax=Streptomyces sp. NPDC005180 TaxID=3156868 RepID=UPI0033BABBB0
MTGSPELTRAQKVLVGVVATGAVVIAGIGFAGSYAAVRALAVKKGFGSFALVFPIGIDAGIVVLLALDLLLAWMRIPFPLLRQTAWLLTAATIAFNGAAAWPDPLGVGMHAVIPLLFVVTVEAARHGVGRLADVTADQHMERVRITRWLLSPAPTFKLWRRMHLWELRSYEQAVGMEQDRLIYQARLAARYGRSWRRKAPVEALLPLRLARFGVPLAVAAQTAAVSLTVGKTLEKDAHPDALTDTPIALQVEPLGAPAVPAAPVPVTAPAYAAKAPKVLREEVTARVPDDAHGDDAHPEEDPDGFGDCEVPVQVPVQEAGQAEEPDAVPTVRQYAEIGQGPRTGDSDDESTKAQATPPGTLPPTEVPIGPPTGAPEEPEEVPIEPPPEVPTPPAEPPLTDAQARYRELSQGWAAALSADPTLTRVAYADSAGVSRRTLHRALEATATT